MCRATGAMARDRSPSKRAEYTGALVPVRLLVAACAVALALPAAALAQGGAGDDQYTDPFGSERATPTPTPQAAAPAPTATPAPAQPEPTTTSAPATAATPAPATASAPVTRQLPYTGAPAWLTGAAGVLLLWSGIALRLRAGSR
jgi:hypothetical protein